MKYFARPTLLGFRHFVFPKVLPVIRASLVITQQALARVHPVTLGGQDFPGERRENSAVDDFLFYNLTPGNRPDRWSPTEIL
jgi:hypothetical protein